MPRQRLIVAALAGLLVLASPAAARPEAATRAAAKPRAKVDGQPGVRHLHFRFGPIRVMPGQNTIVFEDTRRRPKVPGFITSFRPNLGRADGKAPPTDVIHLHHAVWLVNLRPTWAAGEERTTVRLPRGFGWRSRPIAFPLANGPTFDSGELGTGPVGFTAASNRLSWQTPADLAPGTYAYFSGVHPFMRGALRVEG
jgi:hypothetical protein